MKDIHEKDIEIVELKRIPHKVSSVGIHYQVKLNDKFIGYNYNTKIQAKEGKYSLHDEPYKYDSLNRALVAQTHFPDAIITAHKYEYMDA